MKHTILFVAALALFAGCRSVPPSDFTVAVRGESPSCAIVCATNSPVLLQAAEELRKYVWKQTGVTLPVGADAPRRIVLSGDLAEEGVAEDGFMIVPRGDELLICGRGDCGALYGVYELLERFGGVGFYSSWCEKVPALDRFEVPAATRISSSPAFAMRQPFWYDLNAHREFAARLRVNGYNHTAGKVPASVGGDRFRFGGGLPSCHTFYTLCDPKVYFKDHPEYFSLVKGQRLAEHAQLCLTNPDVLEIVTSNVLARIRKDPGARFYGVSQNDCYNFCECERCKAVDDEEESHAGTMVRFVNAVAARVEREFPDVTIETLAYQYTRKPPKKTRLRHNVIPCLCTIECEFARPIPESPYKENKAFMSDIVGWAKQTDRLYLWDYVTQFSHYPQAFPNVYALQGNVRFFRDNGVKMLFEQGDSHGNHGGFAELKAWLLAKWMWNPEADMKALLDEFFPGYYGKGAPFVRAYFEEIHRRQLEISADPEKPLRIYDPANVEPYTDAAFMTWAEEQWQQAEAAVAGTEPFDYNVRMGHFSHLYARLEAKREGRVSAELRNDPEAVELVRRLLKDRKEGRQPIALKEWREKEGILDGWLAIAGE